MLTRRVLRCAMSSGGICHSIRSVLQGRSPIGSFLCYKGVRPSDRFTWSSLGYDCAPLVCILFIGILGKLCPKKPNEETEQKHWEDIESPAEDQNGRCESPRSAPAKGNWKVAAKKNLDLDLDLVLVMVGKTGAGKSETGNTIVGGDSKPFAARAGAISNTKIFEYIDFKYEFQGADKTTRLVATMGLHDTSDGADVLMKRFDVFKHICLDDGVDFFVLCCDGRFAADQEACCQVFWDHCGGKAVEKNACLVFTKQGERTREDFDADIIESDGLKQWTDRINKYYLMGDLAHREKDRVELLDELLKAQNRKGHKRFHAKEFGQATEWRQHMAVKIDTLTQKDDRTLLWVTLRNKS